MEIVKAFTNNKNITILGDINDPLFRASEIGDILDIHCIRSSIIDFNESEKEVRSTHTPNGLQSVTFLTEKGLYKLLFRSRKPIAIEFQNWLCKVIKELRINGNYSMQKEIAINNFKFVATK
uniref:Bro-N domain-containing protein n=1 Tax=viral metagenome TaxID=1070528 RepID=A0A6C0KUC2_9ZZZZ